MRQMLGPSALGRPREIGWRGRWEGGSGWEIQANPGLRKKKKTKWLKGCEQSVTKIPA